MRIYKHVIRYFQPNKSYWLLELNNKYILNFFFGWKLKKNTKISATFGTYKRWFKQKWLKRKI